MIAIKATYRTEIYHQKVKIKMSSSFIFFSASDNIFLKQN